MKTKLLYFMFRNNTFRPAAVFQIYRKKTPDPDFLKPFNLELKSLKNRNDISKMA